MDKFGKSQPVRRLEPDDHGLQVVAANGEHHDGVARDREG